jgi:hypothetical protein
LYFHTQHRTPDWTEQHASCCCCTNIPFPKEKTKTSTKKSTSTKQTPAGHTSPPHQIVFPFPSPWKHNAREKKLLLNTQLETAQAFTNTSSVASAVKTTEEKTLVLF